ncbi:DUF6011 domain-containing protein [Kitasatospora sp. NPDC001119]
MSLPNPLATKDRSMDDNSPRRWWTPRTAPVDAIGGGRQEQESRFRTTTARFRSQAGKVATAARPHLGPIATTFATVAISTLVSSALDRGRASDRGLLPSPLCQPTSGGPSSTCQECGRPLTNELSQQAGYGPTCARYKFLCPPSTRRVPPHIHAWGDPPVHSCRPTGSTAPRHPARPQIRAAPLVRPVALSS